MDSPKTFFDAWINPVTVLTETLNPPNIMEKSVEIYSNWFTNTASITSDAMQTIAKTSQTLPTQMFLVWEPIYKVIYSNTLGLDTIQKLLHTEKYKNILEDTIQIIFPAKIIALLKEKKILEIDINLQKTPSFFKKLSKKMQGWLFFNKTEKPQELQKHIQQLQQFIYQTGTDAISKATNQLIEIAQKRPQLVTFEEFYKIWLTITENDFKVLFENPSFLQTLEILLKESHN